MTKRHAVVKSILIKVYLQFSAKFHASPTFSFYNNSKQYTYQLAGVAMVGFLVNDSFIFNGWLEKIDQNNNSKTELWS